MAFGKNGKSNNKGGEINFVGQNTILKGNIETEGNIRVDGRIMGDIYSSEQLIVGVTGVVVGNIKVKTSIINGTIRGKLEAEEIVILEKKSNFSGELKASKLVIDEGAIFNGTCLMGSEAEISDKLEVSAGKKQTIEVTESAGND